MNKPLVSIVLPVRNAQEYLGECMDSIYQQTLKDWELIVINDHSMDRSSEMINRIAQNDPRIRILQNPGNGLVFALNYGINNSTTPLIARMDADDVMNSRRLEQQFNYLDKNLGIGLVSSRVQHFPKANGRERNGYNNYVNWTNNILTIEDHLLNRFIDSPFAHPSVMFRKSIFEQFGGYREGDFPEDFELWLRWMNHGVKMEKIPNILLSWRDHPRRTSRTNSRYIQTKFQQIKAEYINLWLKSEDKLRRRNIFCWGAGRVARKFARILVEAGIQLDGFVDVDPKKVGNPVSGLPVFSLDNLPTPNDCFVFSIVGSRGAREQVSHYLKRKGFKIGLDYLALA